MSREILTDIIYAHRCRSTHHYIAIDALAKLSGPHADGWRDLLLVEHAALLRGAKAPDAEFKDFKNHVLHVGGDKEWGGARGAASEWYGRAVDALKAKKWVAGAYALGVLSHYYADPLQPFHTGQTEEEGILHGALEWSLFKSRPVLKERIDALAAPKIEAHKETWFVSEMVRAGADLSNPHYQTFIDHYDIHTGKKKPEAGPDDVLLDAAAELLNHAIHGVAVLMDRAMAEAGVKPKQVSTSLPSFLSRLDIPVRKVLKKMDDMSARRAIERAYKEFEATGKVVKSLSDDDAEIRALHAMEVSKRPLSEVDAEQPRETGTQHSARQVETEKPPIKIENTDAEDETLADDHVSAEAETVDDEPKVVEDASAEPPADENEEPEIEPVHSAFRDSDLNVPEEPIQTRTETENTTPAAPTGDFGANGIDEMSHVIAAPSIGKKTAARLIRVGVNTIADLLATDADALADELGQRHITPETVRDWQDQTRLKLTLPHLRVHDVQILVGAGIRTVDDLAAASASDLLEAALAFAETPSALRIIKPEHAPTPDEVDEWIEAGREIAA